MFADNILKKVGHFSAFEGNISSWVSFDLKQSKATYLKKIILELYKMTFMLPGTGFVNHYRLLHENSGSTYILAKKRTKNLAMKVGILETLYNTASALTTVQTLLSSKGPGITSPKHLYKAVRCLYIFHIFVENSSQSSSVLYSIDFPTRDLIVFPSFILLLTKKNRCFQKFCLSHISYFHHFQSFSSTSHVISVCCLPLFQTHLKFLTTSYTCSQ